MNMIFATQGAFADFYLELLPPLKRKIGIKRAGFYVTHRSGYPGYLKKAKNCNCQVSFLREWDITSSVNDRVDTNFIERIEKEYGEPFLWNALIMDRRIFNGSLTKYKQDYPPRFSHTEMLCVLQRFIDFFPFFCTGIFFFVSVFFGG